MKDDATGLTGSFCLKSERSAGRYRTRMEPPVSYSDRARTEPIPPTLESEAPLILHNRLGRAYTIKLVYPGFYLSVNHGQVKFQIAFPLKKENLAKTVAPGHLFFVYVTSPVRRIIGLGRAMRHASFEPERDYRNPWSLDMTWLIQPKMPGVGFADIGLDVAPRVGDSTYSINEEVAAAIIRRLERMDDMTPADLALIKDRYRLIG